MLSISVENRVKRKLKAGELTLCMAINQMRTADAAMIAAACGFDAIFVDLEHSPTSLESASLLCLAALGAGITPIARVASHDSHDATRILDSGAQGIMVPHVENAEQAAAVVRNCKYPPLGHRSASGTGPALRYQSLPQGEINRYINDEVLLIALLETPAAVENAEAIAAVPGIDVLHVGSLDISNELGIPGAYHDPRMRAVYQNVITACRTHDKAMGVGGARGDFELQSELIQLGVRYLTSGSDVSYLMSAARGEVNALRALKLL
jgi:2-keto-3-deoxy-L-rhamnonate aldolase RhmA